MFVAANKANSRVVQFRDTNVAFSGFGDNGGPPLTDNPFHIGFSSGFGDDAAPVGGFDAGFDEGFEK